MSDTFPLDIDVLSSVFDQLNMGVYVTDRKRRILLWNRKAEEITGWKASDIVGHACFDNILSHIDKEGRPLCTTRLCPLFRAMNLGLENPEPILVFARKADGKRVPVSVTAAPLKDKQGNVIGGVETFRDESNTVTDLELAKKIQAHFLPQSLPDTASVRFDVRYYPHSIVGGDFYDVHPLGDDRFGFLVADVQGHGTAAALYTIWLKTLEERVADFTAAPAQFISKLNEQLCQVVVEGGFATAVYGIIDVPAGEVTYCNAGHDVPLYYNANEGNIVKLISHGLPLGIDADETYQTSVIDVEKGDVLLFYTDGITDVRDTDNNALGVDGLSVLFVKHMEKGFDGLLERLYRSALEVNSEVAFPDDVLLFALTRLA